MSHRPNRPRTYLSGRGSPAGPYSQADTAGTEFHGIRAPIFSGRVHGHESVCLRIIDVPFFHRKMQR